MGRFYSDTYSRLTAAVSFQFLRVGNDPEGERILDDLVKDSDGDPDGDLDKNLGKGPSIKKYIDLLHVESDGVLNYDWVEVCHNLLFKPINLKGKIR